MMSQLHLAKVALAVGGLGEYDDLRMHYVSSAIKGPPLLNLAARISAASAAPILLICTSRAGGPKGHCIIGSIFIGPLGLTCAVKIDRFFPGWFVTDWQCTLHNAF